MQIEVVIPALLRDSAGGRTKFTIDATTVADALDVIKRDHPLLRIHVWDDLGRQRQHVLIFLNDEGLKWMPSLDVPLKAGDRLQIVQAISGGAGPLRGDVQPLFVERADAPQLLADPVGTAALVFWGLLICAIDIHFSVRSAGGGFKVDFLHDAIGAFLIVVGALRVRREPVAAANRPAMTFAAA